LQRLQEHISVGLGSTPFVICFKWANANGSMPHHYSALIMELEQQRQYSITPSAGYTRLCATLINTAGKLRLSLADWHCMPGISVDSNPPRPAMQLHGIENCEAAANVKLACSGEPLPYQPSWYAAALISLRLFPLITTAAVPRNLPCIPVSCRRSRSPATLRSQLQHFNAAASPAPHHRCCLFLQAAVHYLPAALHSALRAGQRPQANAAPPATHQLGCAWLTTGQQQDAAQEVQ
jgi:hypothetical protein